MSMEESIDRLEARIAALLAKVSAGEDAYRRGFERGVVFALLMAQGCNAIDPAAPELRRRHRSGSEPSPVGQLDLFAPPPDPC